MFAMKGKSKKSQLQRREEELKKIETRERKFMEGTAQDLVNMRQMLEQMAIALEAHDLTIAALRTLLVQHVPQVTEDLVDRQRQVIADTKRRKFEENQKLAELWNTQVQQMRNDGLAPAEIEQIIREARETKTEPELIRMKRAAAGKAVTDETIPAEAFIFGGN
jgi:predicted phage tail protein